MEGLDQVSRMKQDQIVPHTKQLASGYHRPIWDWTSHLQELRLSPAFGLLD